MIGEGAPAAVIGGVALLERAINYTLGSLQAVRSEALSRPTPCGDWSLGDLLAHLDDSFLALYEAIGGGHVDVPGSRRHPTRTADPAASLRDRACQLLGACTRVDSRRPIWVGGCPLTTGVVTTTGAIEITVHGWDIGWARGRRRPIPPSLAEEMLDLAPLFITPDDRPFRFAPPVDVPPPAAPGDRLLGFLGRDPYRAVAGSALG